MRILNTLSALTLCLCAALAASVTPSLAQKKPVTIVVAEGANIDTLDPLLASHTAAIDLAINIGDQLITYANGKTTGVLAESWKVEAPDHYILNLRKGVRFNDGTNFTAADVKFTLERILDPKTRSGLLPYIALIKSVDVIDDHTVSIRLSAPQVTFLQNLSRGVVMVSKAAFERMGAKEFAEKPVTTGPFKTAEWNRSSEWVLEANEYYWKGRAKIDRVVFRVIPETSTQVAGLLSGELDITSQVGYELIDRINASGVARVELAGGLYQEMIILNMNYGPLADKRVRQALNHAVDVPGIISSVYYKRATPTSQPFSSGVFGHDASIKPYGYDPAKAKQLLAEAGYPNGFTLEMIYPAGGGFTGGMGRIAEIVSRNFAAVGVKVNIQTPDRIEHSRQVYTGGTMRESAVAQLINRVGDADFGIALYFDPSRRAYYFKSPELQDYARRQLTEADPAKREAELKKFAAYLHDQAPWVYLVEVPLLYGASSRLDWKARPDQVIELYQASVK